MAPPVPGLDPRLKNDSARVTYVHPGKKVRPEDLPYPRKNTWWEEAVAIASMLFVFGCAPLPSRRASTCTGYRECTCPCLCSNENPPQLLFTCLGYRECTCRVGFRMSRSPLSLFTSSGAVSLHCRWLCSIEPPPSNCCTRLMGAVSLPAGVCVRVGPATSAIHVPWTLRVCSWV